jgi:hypothetical protein
MKQSDGKTNTFTPKYKKDVGIGCKDFNANTTTWYITPYTQTTVANSY